MLSWCFPACQRAPVLASSAGHLNHSCLVLQMDSVTSELPGASEEGLRKRCRRGGVTVLVQKGPGGGSGAPAPPVPQGSPLTHRLRSLLIAGVHANFSTTIPPTSWQADLPPHHPSSACSDGTLKLNAAASTEGMGGREGGKGRPRAPFSVANCGIQVSAVLSGPTAFSFPLLTLEQPPLNLRTFPAALASS